MAGMSPLWVVVALAWVGTSAAAAVSLDSAGLRALMAVRQPAAIGFVDSADTEASHESAELLAIMDQLSEEFSGAGNAAASLRFATVDCALHRDACSARKIAPGAGAVVKYWTGESFRRCVHPPSKGSLPAQAVPPRFCPPPCVCSRRGCHPSLKPRAPSTADISADVTTDPQTHKPLWLRRERAP